MCVKLHMVSYMCEVYAQVRDDTCAHMSTHTWMSEMLDIIPHHVPLLLSETGLLTDPEVHSLARLTVLDISVSTYLTWLSYRHP